MEYAGLSEPLMGNAAMSPYGFTPGRGFRCCYFQKGVSMSKRQDNLTFRVLEDMTLRAFNAGSAKSDTISEWCCSYIGNPSKTLTTSIPKIVVYDF